ncbi:MAG: protein-glutamate O-methyltransferase CheR, partial [Nitrospirae bacterium]|nr:protein-glutamate O-methyltransferase CheR [Nitrospirota bacterium]
MNILRNECHKEFITDEEIRLFKDLVRKEFGIAIKGDKKLTFYTKLSHRLNILGLTNYRKYYDFIVSDPSKEELYVFASHITNNETYFFREKTQLDVFAEVLKDIKKEKQKKKQHTLNILSLACSSGEE